VAAFSFGHKGSDVEDWLLEDPAVAWGGERGEGVCADRQTQTHKRDTVHTCSRDARQRARAALTGGRCGEKHRGTGRKRTTTWGGQGGGRGGDVGNDSDDVGGHGDGGVGAGVVRRSPPGVILSLPTNTRP